MTTSTPRRPKCSASLCSGAFRLPGRPGLRRSSTWRIVSMCLADEGTYSTTSLSKATKPTRSRWWCTRLVRHAVRMRAEVELRDPPAAVVHRLRHVEQHREVHVRLGFVLLDVVAIRARPQPPVHPADVVTGHVAAVLGKVDRGPEIRRLVQAVDEPVDDGARHEIQVPDAREHHGIHEPRAGNRVYLYRPRYIPDRGRGTASSSRSTIASVVTPSDCAWKLVMMR